VASTYKDILDAVQSTIQGLDLTGVADANVVIGKVPVADKNQGDLFSSLPAVLVAPFGTKQSPPNAGTNASDDITYPVLVATLEASNQSQTSNLDRGLQWHEDIMDAFISKRLSGVATVWNCIIDPRDVFDRGMFARNLDVGGMILRFVSREVRS